MGCFDSLSRALVVHITQNAGINGCFESPSYMANNMTMFVVLHKFKTCLGCCGVVFAFLAVWLPLEASSALITISLITIYYFLSCRYGLRMEKEHGGSNYMRIRVAHKVLQSKGIIL